jgi:hypothetical protein
MKIRIWLALIVIFGMIACGKDKFETVPQLTFRSISPKAPEAVDPGNTLRINIEYTDKEGDVSDSLFILRQRLNKKKPITSPISPYDIPTFPKMDKGEFEITLDYYKHLTLNLTPIPIPGSAKNEPDTLRLKIVARDKAGNKSDTLVVDNVYVIR